jgi:DNA helicase-2/ATP-dependent DNA helicase PcrA
MSPLPDEGVRAEVIQFREGVARLVGGPGCGKSTLLRDRTRALAESGCAAEDIVFLTFTRQAVNSLQADLATLEHPPSVYTLHSYCLSQLRKASGDAYVGLEVLDDAAEECLFKPLAAAALDMSPGELNTNILLFEDSWYNPAAPIPDRRNDFEALLERLKLAFNVALRAELVVRYREYLQEGGKPPVIKHLIVDEYQDLNQAECEVIDMVAAGTDSVIAAGDDDQSIYEFKGGTS